MKERFYADDRGVSITVGYALNLVVATLLIAGVLSATGGMVEDRRDSAIRTELSVLGERVASDLMAADRLASVGGTTAVAVETTLPRKVAATSYEIEIRTSPAEIVLRSSNPEVTVTVEFHHETAVQATTVRGGDLRVVLNSGASPNRLEVTKA
ncbi:DUF7266 family protein [Halorussus halophilus]|uniref:DUF7266 family protein n=1 Tax=Halorussus halophilus TaxID=2650975 RepID=UPI0013010D31|nr:hypothetical protein [Halorussus halophilus]